MSAVGYVFGCIVGFVGSPKKRFPLYEVNHLTIKKLPEYIDLGNEILIAQSIFSVPTLNGVPANFEGFYKYQIIHFGMSLNQFDMYWDLWIDQFEDLLKDLYWERAYANLTIQDIIYETDYKWTAYPELIALDPPQTIKSWKFTGGPRAFEYW